MCYLFWTFSWDFELYYLFVFLINCYIFYSKPPASVQAIDRGLGTMIQLDITLNNKSMTIYGFGQNKKEAKVAAAKMALKNMKKMLSSWLFIVF